MKTAEVLAAFANVSPTTIASRAVGWQASTKLIDVWAEVRPEALDFSHVLVKTKRGLRIASRSDTWATSRGDVGSAAEAEASDWRLTSPASLVDAVRHLAGSPAAFIDGEDLQIITRSDLAKPAGATLLLASVLAVEAALDRLLPSMSGIGDGKYAAAEKKKQWHALTFSEKIPLAIELLPADHVPSQHSLRPLLDDLRTLRNRAAHVARLDQERDGGLSRIDIAHRLVEAWELGTALWDLVDDREAVWGAYEKTVCEFRSNGDWVEVAELAQPFWMLSAQNPKEELLPAAANERRHQALIDAVLRAGHTVRDGRGRAHDGNWAERMVIVANLGRAEALTLSARFGQRSVFEFADGEFRVLSVAGANVRHCRRFPLHPPAVDE